MNQRKRTTALCLSAMIAALYTALSLISGLLGLANMPVQLRLSEALCVLPFFMPEAVLGLTLGCLLSNFLIGGLWQDILFGTLATLLGAIGTLAMRRLRGGRRFLAVLPPILSNTLIIPLVLCHAYGMEEGFLVIALLVGLGELLSVGVGGSFLMVGYERSFGKRRRDS